VDQFAAQTGVVPADRQPRLTLPHNAAPRVTQAITAIRASGRPLIAVHTGPSWPVREWFKERWTELAGALQRRLGAVVVQLGNDVNTGTGPCVAPRIPQTIDWVGKWSLAESVAAIGQMDLLIGIDSGLLHLAGSVGTPCVGLFGAVDGALRLPPETPSRCVMGDVPCLRCHHAVPPGHWRTGCRHDVACMKAISASHVFAVVERFLSDPCFGGSRIVRSP
jgi:ADP-heptose:LPS heptosyltransferase